MTTESFNHSSNLTAQQRLERREVRRRRQRLFNIGERAGVVAVSVAALVGLFYEVKKHDNEQSASTKTEIRAMLHGHVPKGIERITKTSNPDVSQVHYIVQPGEKFETDIAANLHPMAMNQDQIGEDDAIDTYLPPRDRADHVVYPGEEFDFSIDTNSGEILSKPEK